MAMRRRTDEEKIRAREAECVRCRRAGMTWDEVAVATGYASASGAQTAYQRAMDRIVHDDVKAERARMTDQLDMLLSAHWTHALKGAVEHTHTVLRVMERRARLLGLDMPVRTELAITVWDAGTDEGRELIELYEQLAGGLITGIEGSLAEAASGPRVLELEASPTGAAPADPVDAVGAVGDLAVPRRPWSRQDSDGGGVARVDGGIQP